MMPDYRFRAYDAQGTMQDGIIAASSRESALDALARRGSIPFDLAEQLPSQAMPWWQRDVFSSGQLKSAQLASFTRELASLIKAEIPIDEALRIVAAQPMLPSRLRLITKRCLDGVMQGGALSDVLAQQAPAFPDYYHRLVKAGEASGALADVLLDLATVAERAAETRARITSALLYPAILMFAALVAFAVILMVLVPAILPIFEDAGGTPPALIAALAEFQKMIAGHWTIILAAGAALIVAASVASQAPGIRRFVDEFLLKLPLVGQVIERRETARLARTLSVLTRNGVPILEALRITSGVLANRSYSMAVIAASEEVKQGSTLTAPLTRSGLFPDLFLRLMAVGEKTGQVDVMQLRVAEIYESALERQVERLTSLITPALTLIIGGCIGGLIVSVMSAIFAVNDLALK
jgi:general secretion pathway protein F